MAANPFTELHPPSNSPPASSAIASQFLVVEVAQLMASYPRRAPLGFGRRPFYKISLVRGRSWVEYADQVLEINGPSLWFASSRAPYRWHPQTVAQTGYLCALTEEFLLPAPGRMQLATLPVFQPGQCPVRAVSEAQYAALANIFEMMRHAAATDYAYRADLLRAYLLELVHGGQQLWPTLPVPPTPSAAHRLAAQFTALLEQQFPRLAPGQPPLRTAGEFADALAVHVNYLNRVLKAQTGHTTTTLLARRRLQEAQLLLRQSDWTIAEIADGLGFADTSHFCRFFRHATQLAPGAFRATAAVV